MNYRFIAFVVLILTMVEQLAVDVYLPAMPEMARFFSVSSDVIQLTVSYFFLGFALSPLFFGPISDRIGRKKVLLMGVGLYFVSSLCLSMANHVVVLLFFRLLQGVASGALVVANQAMMRDCFSGKKLLLMANMMSLTWSFVPMAAPVIGAYLANMAGWQADFYFLAAVALLLALLISIFLPESHHKKQSASLKNIIQAYKAFLTDRDFVAYVAFNAITFAIVMAFNTAAPFIYEELLQVSIVNYSWLSFMIACAYLIGILVNSVLIIYFDVRFIMRFGIVGLNVSAFYLVYSVWMGLTVFSFSIGASSLIFFEGFIYPNAAALVFAPIRKNTGVASALYGSLQLITCALAAYISAKLPTTSALPISLFMLSLSLLLPLIYFFYLPRQNAVQPGV